MIKQKQISLLLLIVLFFSACTVEKQIKIINVHEHIDSEESAEKLLRANEKVGITQTILVASPQETLLYDGSKGFSGYDENNELVLSLGQKYPDKFLPFCTIYWNDENKLSKLENCVNKGAKGLKLYNGHGFYYGMPLDDFSMKEVYQYANDIKLPILFHVNGGKYLEEFKNVLRDFPQIKVICPHFCLLSTDLPELENMLNTYSNLYLDISFGYVDFMKDGFTRIGKNPDMYRDFLIKYQDRFLWGSDAVITDAAFKDEAWLENMFTAYKDFLEKETFTLQTQQPKKVNIEVKGLHLPQEVLDKIYYQNAVKFFDIYFE